MTDRPILFSAPMVRALLEGRKTQTRRVIKPQPTGRIDPLISFNHGRMEIAFGPDMRDKDGGPKWWRPLAQAGDRLWVREACAIVGTVDPGFVLYRADGYEAECIRHGFDKPFPPETEARWRPSIHMPRWASRLTLEVIDVRVERLQDISEADAIAEGCTQALADDIMQAEELAVYASTHILCPDARARILFETLWDQVNGPSAWERNPWVAAYTFYVINRNIDQIEVAA